MNESPADEDKKNFQQLKEEYLKDLRSTENRDEYVANELAKFEMSRDWANDKVDELTHEVELLKENQTNTPDERLTKKRMAELVALDRLARSVGSGGSFGGSVKYREAADTTETVFGTEINAVTVYDAFNAIAEKHEGVNVGENKGGDKCLRASKDGITQAARNEVAAFRDEYLNE
jgi:uncharacterized protein YnzC (UPF0291/DUF896 family)